MKNLKDFHDNRHTLKISDIVSRVAEHELACSSGYGHYKSLRVRHVCGSSKVTYTILTDNGREIDTESVEEAVLRYNFLL